MFDDRGWREFKLEVPCEPGMDLNRHRDDHRHEEILEIIDRIAELVPSAYADRKAGCIIHELRPKHT